jgi:hypothetical protein
MSAATMMKTPDGSQALMQKSLGEGLELRTEDNTFCIFRDHVTGLEYIRDNQQLHEKGLYVELNAYQRHVFLDFREVVDHDGRYARLEDYLSGRGVPSIDEAVDQLLLQPIHEPFRELMNVETLRWLTAAAQEGDNTEEGPAMLDSIEGRLTHLFSAARQFAGGSDGDARVLARQARDELESLLKLGQTVTPAIPLAPPSASPNVDTGGQGASEDARVFASLPADGQKAQPGANEPYINPLLQDPTGFAWVFVHALGKVGVEGESGFEQQSRSWVDEWQLGKVIVETLRAYGMDAFNASQSLALVKALTTHQRWYVGAGTTGARGILYGLLRDPDVQQVLQVNRYHDVLWFNKESFERLLEWLALLAQLGRDETAQGKPAAPAQQAGAAERAVDRSILDTLRRAEEKSEYQVEKLLQATT